MEKELIELSDFIDKYDISDQRKKDILSMEVLILPEKRRDIDNTLFIESIDISKLLEQKGIGVDYLCENKKDTNILDFKSRETELIFLVLELAIMPLFLNVLGSWIYDKYIKEKKKEAKLKVKIYQKFGDKITYGKFEGDAEDVLKAIGYTEK